MGLHAANDAVDGVAAIERNVPRGGHHGLERGRAWVREPKAFHKRSQSSHLHQTLASALALLAWFLRVGGRRDRVDIPPRVALGLSCFLQCGIDVDGKPKRNMRCIPLRNHHGVLFRTVNRIQKLLHMSKHFGRKLIVRERAKHLAHNEMHAAEVGREKRPVSPKPPAHIGRHVACVTANHHNLAPEQILLTGNAGPQHLQSDFVFLNRPYSHFLVVHFLFTDRIDQRRHKPATPGTDDTGVEKRSLGDGVFLADAAVLGLLGLLCVAPVAQKQLNRGRVLVIFGAVAMHALVVGKREILRKRLPWRKQDFAPRDQIPTVHLFGL
eukprot:comp20361_c0_seq1/m.40723 comp20361_c0_seq1/g.40723  ORF comp20361_c0_seq1/g.40723 comp20361_c0_seq1/m.40723 type:complete len:325 (+) comp20361_c0_seq1:421-1395(+)